MPSSSTPEGTPELCPICGKSLCVEVSRPPGDSTCPHCGALVWPDTPKRAALVRRPVLIAENGPDSGHIYRLRDGETVLGRHAECDIVLDVGAVSRYHCKVVAKGAEASIEDLASRGGTFVNEVATAASTPLKHGDQIRICDVVLRFEVVEQDDQPHTTEPELSALEKVTRSLHGAVTLDRVLPQLLDSLFHVFPLAERGFILLVDDSGTLVPRWTKVRREYSDEENLVFRTIDEQTLERKEAIVSSDAANGPRTPVVSMMRVPIIDFEGKAIGILQIDSCDRDCRFEESELELLVSLTSLGACAINNARIHEDQLEQHALERDLKLAVELQQAFIPDEQPDVEGYEFFEFFRAANHICGDYRDYVLLPDGRIVMIVGDVVGYGLGAAMLGAKALSEARFCLASEPHLAIAVANLNRRICRLGVNRFVTNLVIALNVQKHEVTIVNAGHPPPIIRHADGSLEELGQETAGLPLGILDNVNYEQVSVDLQPGESLLMFTDGIATATIESGLPFIEHLRRLIGDSDQSPQAIGESVVAGLRKHLGDAPRDDDMCFISFGRVPAADRDGYTSSF